MTDQEILASCTRVLRNLLGDDSIHLAMNTRRADVPNWDSFNYVTFIVAIEMEFGVTFGTGEVESFDDVGALVRRLKSLKPTV